MIYKFVFILKKDIILFILIKKIIYKSPILRFITKND